MVRAIQLLFCGVFISLTLYSNATSEVPKGLDAVILDQLKKSFPSTAAQRAAINALTANDLHKLVLNREMVNRHNEVFNVKTEVKGITDQKSTGRCWMFAGLNLMRPTARQKFNLENFEFSQNYLFFYDKLEKSNFFLEFIIETRKRAIDDRELQELLDQPIGDGGWWSYVVSLIEKYGVVPKELMPETENSSKSNRLNKILGNLLRQNAADLRTLSEQGKNVTQLRDQKLEMMKKVYLLLVIHLGMPPEEFNWRYEDKDKKIFDQVYTPISFYNQAVGFDLKKYVTLFDHPVHPYNKHYQVNFRRNFADLSDMNFLNIEISRLKEYALKSLLSNEPVWFAADVSWQMERENGIMAEGIYDYESLLDLSFHMSKAERIAYRASSANHAMALVGADTSGGKVNKWWVENSWGSEAGDKGYWSMYDSWFDRYVFTIIINEKYLPKEVLDLLKTKPTILPSWDPLAKEL
jgi:bleomycin hydrolase